MRKALEAQQELLAALDSLEMELAELTRDLEATGLADPELQEELRELQRFLDELAPESLEEFLDDLAEQLDEMTGDDAGEALRELVGDQEALRDPAGSGHRAVRAGRNGAGLPGDRRGGGGTRTAGAGVGRRHE